MPCILTEYHKGVDAGRGAGVAAGHSLKFRFAEEAWFTLFVAICLSRHGSAPFSELCGSLVMCRAEGEKGSPWPFGRRLSFSCVDGVGCGHAPPDAAELASLLQEIIPQLLALILARLDRDGHADHSRSRGRWRLLRRWCAVW
jgi:hypothetical protein